MGPLHLMPYAFYVLKHFKHILFHGKAQLGCNQALDMSSDKPTPRASNFVPKVILSGGSLTGYGVAPQAGFSLEFHNGTSEEVSVLTRTGVRLEIPPIQGVRPAGFIIRSTYKVGYGVKADSSDLWNDAGHQTSMEAKQIEAVMYRDDLRPGRAQPFNGVVDYVIARQDFIDNGGALYLSNLDITLSILNRNFRLRHPFSNAGIRSHLTNADPILTSAGGFSYQVKIVDRHRRFGDRFVNIGGEIFHIRSIVNSDLPDGVYLTSHAPATGELENTLPRANVYTFEEADKALNLYITYSEAKTLGNPADLYKKELEERAYQLKLEDHRLKLERQSRDAEYEQAKRDLEIERDKTRALQQKREDDLQLKEYELTRMEHEYRLRDNQIKRDTLLLKEVFEDRALSRKESLELLKYIPALVSGLGAIYLAIKKLKG